MRTLADQLADVPTLNRVVVPDLWQQQAVGALRDGKDVVVQAPTGAGKTLIFELWSNGGRNRGQAIYTVPTRALANDKLAEWRAAGWNVGIATGDLAENLNAPVVVATLETQKNRLIQGIGPNLLVVDEYQMIGDPDRGLNYELTLALAPRETQLLLLSGSVGNPQDVVKWLRRLGRDALLVKHDLRPVPQEEVYANNLSYRLPSEIRGYWPRLVAKALAEDLGPILVFAPRRQAAESLASELMRQLPTPNPLQLSAVQKQIVGESMGRMLKSRVAFHHSGLSYGARAGVIEPLAKAGQLRVVVATMGLAAGINFSLRSVALAGESYRRDESEQPLKADEILQMFGRAGRRGIDETGFILVTANEIRLLEAHPCHLSRSGMVDWSALLGLMHAAAYRGKEPFAEAVRVQERLFTSKPIHLGVEESLRHPETPCGLRTDAERARLVRKRFSKILNSRGEWQAAPPLQERPLRDVFVVGRSPESPLSESPGEHETRLSATAQQLVALRPALGNPAAVERIGTGTLCVLDQQGEERTFGRALTVAERLAGDRVVIAKWVRRLTNWNGRQAPLSVWNEKIVPLLEKGLIRQRTPLVRLVNQPAHIIAQVSLGDQTVRVPVDAYGVALWRPPERDVLPPACSSCAHIETCRQLSAATGTALVWRRLGLVDISGKPTRRGRVVSFFSYGDGLAIAAALEESAYPVDELVYDLANLDAGFRFAGDDNRWGGRLALACQRLYGLQRIPGYLENGVPPKYGAGAAEIVASVHKDPLSRHAWITEWLGAGDIDRMIIEWRSLLRQIARAPELDWGRWQELQRRSREILQETESPTVTDLPPLEYLQTRRVDHRLILPRH